MIEDLRSASNFLAHACKSLSQANNNWAPSDPDLDDLRAATAKIWAKVKIRLEGMKPGADAEAVQTILDKSLAALKLDERIDDVQHEMRSIRLQVDDRIDDLARRQNRFLDRLRAAAQQE